MMKYFRIITVLVISILFVACGSRVRTERPVEKDLSQYQTFAYLPNANVDVEGRGYSDENVNRTIVDAINRNMKQAGYTLDRGNPDLLVLVRVNTRLGQERRMEPVYSYYPYTGPIGTINPIYDPFYFRGYRGWMDAGGIIGYTTDTSLYEEGTVIIDVVDRETRETVWRGTLSEDIFGEGTTQAITEMVDEVFEEFPLNNQ